MTLSVVKHAGQCDYVAKIFDMKGPTFEKIIIEFVKIVAQYAYKLFVDDLTEKCTVQVVNAKEQHFEYYSFSLYATGATFQRSNRPSATLQVTKIFYIVKHKLYV